jgi:GNAT superfamily N-acetyltransferase
VGESVLPARYSIFARVGYQRGGFASAASLRPTSGQSCGRVCVARLRFALRASASRASSAAPLAGPLVHNTLCALDRLQMVTCREMPLDDLPNRIMDIDVSERGAVVYYWVNGKLVAIPEGWNRPRWTQDLIYQESWTKVLGLNGVRAWGAFNHERLVGLVVYRPYLTDEMAQLAALFVSKDHRRQGIAARLTRKVIRQAELDGFTKLYVSATPSESAVSFYQAQGFTPTQETHPELYALEPEDIHMVKQL